VHLCRCPRLGRRLFRFARLSRGFYRLDGNSEALRAFGRFDRILGAGADFGCGLFKPYMVEGARWTWDNRTQSGLLHSGWSTEHLGDKDQPHYQEKLK
jgi:hypothetical protein